MSVYPFLGAELPARKIKMAMAWRRHYRWSEIEPRHFYVVGQRIGLSREKIDRLLSEIKQKAPTALDELETILPKELLKNNLGIHPRLGAIS